MKIGKDGSKVDDSDGFTANTFSAAIDRDPTSAMLAQSPRTILGRSELWRARLRRYHYMGIRTLASRDPDQ